MSDYDTLVGTKSTEGSIKNWVNRTNIPATTILTEAEALIYQELRVREMVQATTGTLSATSQVITISTTFTGFRQPIRFFFTGNSTAVKYIPRFVPIDEVLDAHEYDSDGNQVQGAPSMWGLEGDTIRFEKPTDIARPYRFSYYRALDALSGSNTTNFLTDRYPGLLRAACLYKVAEFDKDDRERRHWAGALADEIRRANVQNDLELSGMETDYDYEAA